MIGSRDFHFFVPVLLLSILTTLFLPSLSASYFVLAVPMLECLGKHTGMSSQFPIDRLMVLYFFAKRDDLLRRRVASQKLTIIIFLPLFLSLILFLLFTFASISHAQVFPIAMLNRACSLRSAKTAIRSVSRVC